MYNNMKLLFKVLVFIVLMIGAVSCGGSKKGIRIVPDETQRKVDVFYDGKLFTSYIYPEDLEKPVLYPIYTANGTVITRGFPRDPRPNERVDHEHHVGFWFTFGDVNGVDFWGTSYAIPAGQRSGYGTVRHCDVINVQSGIKQGTLVVTADWVDYYENLLLKEETKYIFSGEGDWRLIERITKLTAQQDTVTFNDTKEGMIAIRMDRAFEEPSNTPELYLDSQGNPTEVKVMNNTGVNGVYRNSEGFEKGEVWGKPAKWVSLSADKAGEKISVAILDHKNNAGYPAYSHARGYGLFSTNNMGAQAFNKDAPQFKLTLNPGQSVIFRHIIIVKTGSFATKEELNRLFNKFNQL